MHFVLAMSHVQVLWWWNTISKTTSVSEKS